MNKKIKIGLLAYGLITFVWLLLSGIDMVLTPIGQDLAPSNIVNFFFAAPLLYYLSMVNMGWSIIAALIEHIQNATP